MKVICCDLLSAEGEKAGNVELGKITVIQKRKTKQTKNPTLPVCKQANESMISCGQIPTSTIKSYRRSPGKGVHLSYVNDFKPMAELLGVHENLKALHNSLWV